MILTDEELDAALQPLGVARYSTLMRPADVHRIARAIESAVLRKLRERPADAYLIDWPDEPDLGDYFAYEPSGCGRSRPLYIIPEVNE